MSRRLIRVRVRGGGRAARGGRRAGAPRGRRARLAGRRAGRRPRVSRRARRARRGTRSTLLPFDPARALLGLGDELRFRARGTAASRPCRQQGSGFDNGLSESRVRGELEAELTELARSGDRRRAPRRPTTCSASSPSPTRGHRADRPGARRPERGRLPGRGPARPGNEDAKFNLELLLQQLVAKGTRRGADNDGGRPVEGPPRRGRRNPRAGVLSARLARLPDAARRALGAPRPRAARGARARRPPGGTRPERAGAAGAVHRRPRWPSCAGSPGSRCFSASPPRSPSSARRARSRCEPTPRSTSSSTIRARCSPPDRPGTPTRIARARDEAIRLRAGAPRRARRRGDDERPPSAPPAAEPGSGGVRADGPARGPGQRAAAGEHRRHRDHARRARGARHPELLRALGPQAARDRADRRREPALRRAGDRARACTQAGSGPDPRARFVA